MTKLLQAAIERLCELPPDMQDAVASAILAQLDAQNRADSEFIEDSEA